MIAIIVGGTARVPEDDRNYRRRYRKGIQGTLQSSQGEPQGCPRMTEIITRRTARVSKDDGNHRRERLDSGRRRWWPLPSEDRSIAYDGSIHEERSSNLDKRGFEPSCLTIAPSRPKGSVPAGR